MGNLEISRVRPCDAFVLEILALFGNSKPVTLWLKAFPLSLIVFFLDIGI